MYGRAGLERFKKAQSSEPFSVSSNSVLKTSAPSAPKAASHPSVQYSQAPVQPYVPHKQAAPEEAPLVVQSQQATQVGGGQSTWQPPEWAIEPGAGVYYLEVLKDGEVLDRISLNQRRHIFGRHSQTCDFVLDHPSVSRQHASVIPHKNGGSDLGC